jgi:hypothetical protein
MVHLKELEDKEQAKPLISWRKKKTNIKTEWN